MTNATLRGKPDAGNPHVRFDEGEVASTKPRRGSLLYKFDKILEAALPEAAKALPRGFANGSMADLRRAFVLWVTMAMVGLAAAG